MNKFGLASAPWVNLLTAPPEKACGGKNPGVCVLVRTHAFYGGAVEGECRRLVVFLPIFYDKLLTIISRAPGKPSLMLGADDKRDEPHIPTHVQVPALQEHTDWPGAVA